MDALRGHMLWGRLSVIGWTRQSILQKEVNFFPRPPWFLLNGPIFTEAMVAGTEAMHGIVGRIRASLPNVHALTLRTCKHITCCMTKCGLRRQIELRLLIIGLKDREMGLGWLRG